MVCNSSLFIPTIYVIISKSSSDVEILEKNEESGQRRQVLKSRYILTSWISLQKIINDFPWETVFSFRLVRYFSFYILWVLSVVKWQWYSPLSTLTENPSYFTFMLFICFSNWKWVPLTTVSTPRSIHKPFFASQLPGVNWSPPLFLFSSTGGIRLMVQKKNQTNSFSLTSYVIECFLETVPQIRYSPLLLGHTFLAYLFQSTSQENPFNPLCLLTSIKKPQYFLSPHFPSPASKD